MRVNEFRLRFGPHKLDYDSWLVVEDGAGAECARSVCCTCGYRVNSTSGGVGSQAAFDKHLARASARFPRSH